MSSPSQNPLNGCALIIGLLALLVAGGSIYNWWTGYREQRRQERVAARAQQMHEDQQRNIAQRPAPTPQERAAATERVREMLYRDAWEAHALRSSAALVTFGQTLANPRFGDTRWALDAGVACLELVHQADDWPPTATVPNRYREAHTYYTDAVREMAAIGRDAPAAIDSLSPKALDRLQARADRVDRLLAKTRKALPPAPG